MDTPNGSGAAPSARICLSGDPLCTGLLPCAECLPAIAQLVLVPALQAVDRSITCPECKTELARVLTHESVQAFFEAFGRSRADLITRARESLATSPPPQPQPPSPDKPKRRAPRAPNGVSTSHAADMPTKKQEKEEKSHDPASSADQEREGLDAGRSG